MARGGVKGFGDLVGTVGDDSAVDGRVKVDTGVTHRPTITRSVALNDLCSNPRNPREFIGDLDDLASIADFQLQPVVVVTRSAFRDLYPDAEIATKWVVALGNRRLAAAHKYGRPELDIIVRDDLAKDRATLLAAAIAENVDRAGFDVIEEANAVESLVQELGSGDAVAEQLKKSKTWVSQRRALLKLAPELQEATRRGDLAIRQARALAQVPMEEQVERWNADRKRGAAQDPGEGRRGKDAKSRGDSGARLVARALRRFDAEPDELATALHGHLGEDGARALVERLRKLLN
ncbi:ParB/RepB/Spo0J family partition protein [Mycolicibacterium moriokaense]|nr:ParB/RepB/Spo0J family partition protein [Mycolicibacterium moriokaense]